MQHQGVHCDCIGLTKPEGKGYLRRPHMPQQMWAIHLLLKYFYHCEYLFRSNSVSFRPVKPSGLSRQSGCSRRADEDLSACSWLCALQVFQDGLGEAQKYLDTGESPAGFSTMPASPEVAPEEASAKPGKRPGSAKAREGGPGGPGISKDAGEALGMYRALQQPF